MGGVGRDGHQAVRQGDGGEVISVDAAGLIGRGPDSIGPRPSFTSPSGRTG